MTTPSHRRRYAATALAVVAAAELVCGIVLLDRTVVHSRPRAPLAANRAAPSGPSRAEANPNGSPQPSSTVPGSVFSPSNAAAVAQPTVTPTTATPPVGTTPGSSQSGAAVVGGSGPAPAPTPPAGSSTAGSASGAASAPPVTCHTDLPLSQAPDTGYDFLCEQGTTPLTWSKSNIEVFEHGLNPVQDAAFAAAVAQWEAVGKFQVTYTADQSAADVVVTAAGLTAQQPGYTEDGYTTVSYRCQSACGYYHAAVELSSSATLTQTNWVSTILHELGHVAGLNHVSDKAEVMYPYLSLTSPAAYAAGDQAGLAVLASERGA